LARISFHIVGPKKADEGIKIYLVMMRYGSYQDIRLKDGKNEPKDGKDT
jgi:hypothetical protein